MIKNRLKYAIDCSKCAVCHLCLGKNLNNTEIAALNELITSFKVVSKGEHVYYANDTMQHLYAVQTGSCKEYWVDEQGNERIDNFYFPGDIIGFESIPNRKHFYSLTSLEDSQLCIIPLDAMFELMHKHDGLLKRVMNITSYKMQNDHYVGMTTKVNQRIADFILNILYRLEERHQCDEYISLPMSQLDISNFLGMAHETVNRTLRKLHNDKIIKIINKKIYINDIDNLKKIGTSIEHFAQV